MSEPVIDRSPFVFLIVVGGVAGFALTCAMLHLSIWWGTAAVPLGVGILVLQHQAANGKSNASIALRSVWSVAMLGAAFVWIPMIVMVIINALLQRAPGRYTNWIAVLVWPVGWIAFRFKQFNQKYYGWVEIGFGILTALAITVNGVFGPTQGLAVLGAIYVVSRGYGNITDAEKKKDEIERNAQAFREYRARVKVAFRNLWLTTTNRDIAKR
jgi:hypothetical protein